MVPETVDCEPLIMKPQIPDRILVLRVRMLTSVHFYHNFLFKTDKVDNVPPNRLLPAKFRSIKLFPSKMLP